MVWKLFKITLVTLSAIFMAYHTQIFIHRIEPNVWFSWLASGLIEGMLISLAVMRATLLNRVLLGLVFLVSVCSASASFVVRNEQLLDQFFTQKRVIEQVRDDIIETRKAYQLGQKYTTKTLLRERQLQDELRSILKGQTGDITVANVFIFFVLVLVIQSVSVYISTTLKSVPVVPSEPVPSVPEPVPSVPEPVQSETKRCDDKTVTCGVDCLDKANREAKKEELNIPKPVETVEDENDLVVGVMSLKQKGYTIREIAEKLGISKSKVGRILRS